MQHTSELPVQHLSFHIDLPSNVIFMPSEPFLKKF